MRSTLKTDATLTFRLKERQALKKRRKNKSKKNAQQKRHFCQKNVTKSKVHVRNSSIDRKLWV